MHLWAVISNSASNQICLKYAYQIFNHLTIRPQKIRNPTKCSKIHRWRRRFLKIFDIFEHSCHFWKKLAIFATLCKAGFYFLRSRRETSWAQDVFFNGGLDRNPKNWIIGVRQWLSASRAASHSSGGVAAAAAHQYVGDEQERLRS